jgi:thiamine-monophosphate kinase
MDRDTTRGDQTHLTEFGENRMVSRFRQLANAATPPGVLLGPGDDTAILRVPADRVALLTCDMMAEGVHFRLDWATPWQIGWKAMAQNVSDIAAMGGEPGYAVASVSLPGSAPKQMAEEIAQGLIAAASEYGAALVGGDLVGSTGPVTIDVSLLGWVEEARALRRSGARPGDQILVTGALGASGAGLSLLLLGLTTARDADETAALAAHFTPRARVKEGRTLAATGCVTAMMDLSDGLAADLPRLCTESGVGARLYAAQIPIAPACAAVAPRVGAEALTLALTGGEDYELLFTCPASAAPYLAAEVGAATGTRVTAIGEVVPGDGIIMVDTAGNERPLGQGFDHFRVGA